MADMKLRLRIAEDDIFYYPDLMVTCDPSDDAPYYKTRPTVLVEVLSPSTERLDRREKFLSYQRLPSLEEYVLVDQERMRVTVFRRQGSGSRSTSDPRMRSNSRPSPSSNRWPPFTKTCCRNSAVPRKDQVSSNPPESASQQSEMAAKRRREAQKVDKPVNGSGNFAPFEASLRRFPIRITIP